MSRSNVGILASYVRGGGTGSPNYLTNVVGHWDASQPTTTASFVEDLVGPCDLTATALTTGTQNGLTTIVSAGGNNARMVTPSSLSPVDNRIHNVDPWGITLVYKEAGNSVQFDTGSSGSIVRPHVYNFGSWTASDTSTVVMGARDTDWHVFYWEFNGAATKLYVDGALINTGSPGTATETTDQLWFMNTWDWAVDPPSGTVFAEAKATLGTQTTDNILLEAEALAYKWGFGSPPDPVDPPDPPEVVDMLVGATVRRETGESQEQAIDRFNTDIAADIQIARKFFPNALPADLTTSATTSGDFGERHRCYSWKSTMTQGQIETSLNSIPDDGFITYIAWNHEPENDGGVMTPAYFKARQATLLAACNAVGNPDIRPTVIYMYWLEFDGNPATSTADWFPDGDLADWVMGLDPYDTNGVRSMEYLTAPTLALWRAAGGVEWLIAETGTQRMVTGTDASGAAWIADSCDWLRSENCTAVMWWNDTKANDWRMDNYPLMLAAWGNEIP